MSHQRSLAPVLGTLLLLVLLVLIGAARHWEIALPMVGLLRFGEWLARGVYCSIPVLVAGAAISALLWRRGNEPPPLVRLAACWGAGWAAVIVIGIAALALGIYSPLLWQVLAPVGWIVLAGWLIVERRSWTTTLRDRLRAVAWVGPPLLSWNSLLVALLLVAALHGSLPPDARDELGYHLVLPQLWGVQGDWWVPSDNFHLMFPGNAELVWAWAVATGGALAPRFITLVFALMTVGLLWHHIGRAGAPRWTRDASLVCLLITPMALTSAATCYVEWPLVFFMMLGWTFARPGCATTARAAVAVTSASWAVTVGMKYTALLFVGLLAVGWLVARCKEQPRRALTAGVALVIALGLLAAPWFVRNWFATGDPVYPLGGLLGIGPVGTEAADVAGYARLDGLWRWLPWLYHATADPIADHRLHPLWLVLHLAILVAGWRWRHELPWWTIVGATLALLPFEPAPRIYLPILVLESMFIPLLLTPLDRVLGGRTLVTAALLATAVLSIPVAAYELLVAGGSAVPNYVIGLTDRDDYLRTRGVVTPVVGAVRSESPPDSRVWTWCEDRVLYFDRWTRPDSPYGPPASLAILGEQGPDALTTAASAVDFIAVRRDRCPGDWGRVVFETRAWLVDPDVQAAMTTWISGHLSEVAGDSRYVLYRVEHD
jgi:hypothetical protein